MSIFHGNSPLQDLSVVMRNLQACGVQQVMMEVKERVPVIALGTQTSKSTSSNGTNVSSLPEGISTPAVASAIPQQSSSTIFSIHDITEEILRGFWVGEDLVYPDLSQASINPFIRTPLLIVPCHRATYVPEEFPNVKKTKKQDTLSDIKATAGKLASLRNTTTVVRKNPKKGTSCHQCKNTKRINHLAFCSRKFDKRSRKEKRTCRKKFCQLCLMKFYNESIDKVFECPNWVCPSCREECVCAACTRGRGSVEGSVPGDSRVEISKSSDSVVSDSSSEFSSQTSPVVKPKESSPVPSFSPGSQRSAFQSCNQQLRLTPSSTPLWSAMIHAGDKNANNSQTDNSDA